MTYFYKSVYMEQYEPPNNHIITGTISLKSFVLTKKGHSVIYSRDMVCELFHKFVYTDYLTIET